MRLGRMGLGHARIVGFLLLAAMWGPDAWAGVSRLIQERYRRDYGSKALFLRLPVFAERKTILITGQEFRSEADPAGTARFKVGDQIRVTAIDFAGYEIRFRISAISGVGAAEIVYRFDAELQEDFPNSEVFDRAVQATFTEGLKYADIEDAKRGYVEDSFERFVRETAALTSSTREAILKNTATRLPAYQDALRDIENLKRRNQDLADQLAQSRSEARRLENELKTQQSEAGRLRSANASLQEKIDASSLELRRLGEEARSARGVTQGYQRELSNLQQSLNIKVDASRDLGSQIGELAQAMRKIQRENASLSSQNSALTTNVAGLQAASAKLAKKVEDLEASNRQKDETIAILTSKEDSLARQYIELKEVKEKLESVTRSIGSLRTQTKEEKSAGGFRSGTISVLLSNILLGSVAYRLPERLSHNQETAAEAAFVAESIDSVRLSPEQREILKSFGDKLRIEAQLSPSIPALNVKPEGSDAPQEAGERERLSWRWRVLNTGTSDARLLLSIRLVNRNSDRIPLLRHELPVSSANIVRQIRESLQWIPLAVGTLIGFVLFAVVGVFRRFAGRAPSTSVPRHSGPKQL
ncbi:MAG: hypothetical protein HXY20_11265 [Acidobacteria bacterium]|nr:hypothetical protein [Acidobacteriota bacterium]